ncbi:MAG: CBS domain-containing protein [Gaiellales bacterium]
MKAAEIMQTDLVTCPPHTTVAEAAGVMCERGVGACLVMDGPRLAGVFTERDLLRLAATGEDVRDRPVTEAMTTAVTTAPPDSDLLWVADTMRRLHVRHLPVASEDGMVAGIVSLRDLFAAAEAVLRLDPRGAEAAREVLAAAGR